MKDSGKSKWKKNRTPYVPMNSVEWIQSGREFFDMLERLIDSAESEIHLQTYIFDSDETGNRVAEALIRAAIRKIPVFLLVDAFGSQGLSVDMISRLTNAGVNFRKYGKLYSRGTFHIGRRLHHKVTVFDGQISIVGGINISDNYNDTEGSKAWLDFAVILRGEISRQLEFLCRQRWYGWKFSFRNSKKKLQENTSPAFVSGASEIRIRRNDFIRNKQQITFSYRNAIRHAEKSILIVGGYFLPGGKTRRLMKNAIERGVKINIVVSEKSDVGILINARRYLYDWLIRNNIGVFEYKPSNVHGKVIITDGKWTSIGSYDLNNLSSFSNIELNVDINDAKFSEQLSEYISNIIKADCHEITRENNSREKSVFIRIRRWLSYHSVKTLFGLSVLLAGKKEKEF